MGALAGPAGCTADDDTGSAEGEGAGESGAWLIGASIGTFRSHLHFGEKLDPDFNQSSVVGTVGYFWPSGWGFSVSAGAMLGGYVLEGGDHFTLEPGWVVALRMSKLVLPEKGAVPFIDLSLSLTFSMSTITGGGMPEGKIIATDVRFSASFGYTFGDIWRVSLSPRVFGGPISWERNGEAVRGRDRYFFQLGMGSSLLLPGGWMIFVDGSALGEKSLTGGIAAVF